MGISTVTSEALQLKLRQLLPSQQGFGTDLSASDTIIPIIDLTEAAEGSDVRETLQSALAFGNQTAFATTNGTDALATTAGFYRVIGTATCITSATFASEVSINLTDGVTIKKIYLKKVSSSATVLTVNADFDFVAFLDVGDTLNAVSNSSINQISGSVRQIADNNGVLVNPIGFNPQ